MGSTLETLILVIGLSSLFLFFWFFKKSNFTNSISTLFISGLFLRIYTAFDPFLHSWDERYHALVAKNLLKHPLVPTLYDTPILDHDLLWVGSHIWLHKQPLTLWMISGSIFIFGNTDFAVRVPSIILSSLMIWLTFAIGKLLFNARIGVIAAFFITVNGLIIELAAGRVATDHVDISFAFFIELAIYFAILHWKKQKIVWLFLMSAAIGLAILCKWLPALIVIPFWLLLSFDKTNWRKAIIPLGVSLFIIGIITLPWQIYVFSLFPLEAANEQAMNWRHFTEVLEGRTGPFYYFIDKIRINYGELIYLPLIWFFWKGKNLISQNIFFALSTWIIVPLLFFSIPLTKMQGYILFIAPALFLVVAYFLDNLNTINLFSKKSWIPKLIFFAFFFLAIRYSVERMKIGAERGIPAWKTEILEIEKNNRGKKLVIFNCENYVEAMYYTEFIAYHKIPTKEDIKKVEEAGYEFLILPNKNKR